jgi:hypothetical protein
VTLSFQRQQAGEYNVLENGKAFAYIQKAKSSKWITYFCTNPAMKGKPQKVSKTLKESKAFCESYVGSSPAPSVAINEDSLELDTLLKDVKAQNPDKYEMMKEMLETDYVIDLNEYRQTEDGLEQVKQPFSDFLTPEEAAAL